MVIRSRLGRAQQLPKNVLDLDLVQAQLLQQLSATASGKAYGGQSNMEAHILARILKTVHYVIIATKDNF